MTDYNVQLKDSAAVNNLYPKTITDMVFNSDGEPIGNVEPGAQANVIEKITVNGVELSILNKTVDISVEDISVPQYSIEKTETTDDGYALSYQLTKNGDAVGDKINIPKDLVVESGSVKICEADDSPVEGYVTGDKYIDLVLANSDDKHIYVLVSDLVNTYEAGDGINITGQTISVDIDALKETFSGEYIKAEIEDLLALKADINDVYTSDEVDTAIKTALSSVYTKEETDSAISAAIDYMPYLTYELLA